MNSVDSRSVTIAVVFAIVGLLSVATISAATAPKGQSSSTLQIDDQSIVRAENTNLTASLASIPEGFSGGTLTFTVSSPDIAGIEAFHPGQQVTLLNTSRSDGQNQITVRIADLNNTVRSGDGPVVLGRLQVTGTKAGTTGVTTKTVRLDDDHGNRIQTTTNSGSLSVQQPEPVTVRVIEKTDSRTLQILAEPVQSGLSGYRMTVRVDEATIESGTFPSYWRETNATVHDNETAITLRAIDTRNAVKPGGGRAVLASISLSGATQGEPGVAVKALTDDVGHSLEFSVVGGTNQSNRGTDSESACVASTRKATELRQTLAKVGNLLVFVIGAIAVPNGAFGLFEWMTAGSNVDRARSGQKRIRNTFVAIGGTAILKVAIGLYVASPC